MIYLYLENNRCRRGALILQLVTINPAFYTHCIWCTWCKLKPYFLSFLPSYLLSFGHKLKCEFKKENKTIHYYSREGHDSLSINFGIKCNMTVGENIFLITSETIHYQKYWNIFYKYTQFAFLVIISVWEIESNTGYWMLQYSSISAIWFIWAQPPVASVNGDPSLYLSSFLLLQFTSSVGEHYFKIQH